VDLPIHFIKVKREMNPTKLEITLDSLREIRKLIGGNHKVYLTVPLTTDDLVEVTGAIITLTTLLGKGEFKTYHWEGE